MQWLRKKKKIGKKSEGGFVLILALIGIMILIAVGYFALTVSTSDLRIAARLVGERKAFSAAEAGVHALVSSYTGTPADITAGWMPVDSAGDPFSFYRVTVSTEVAGLSNACTGAFSIEGGVSWHCKNYLSNVEGKNDRYASTVTIAVGVKGRAVPDTPGYDFN